MSKYLVEGKRVAFLDNYFFMKPFPMPEADGESFEPLGDWFGRDRRHVFFLHRLVEDADPQSFTPLGGYNDQWAKDRTRAYHFRPSKAAGNFRAIETDSLESFGLLPGDRFAEHARDACRIYRKGRVLRGADVARFEIPVEDELGVPGLPSVHFARDARRVYFDGRLIAGADAGSFRVLRGGGVGHDAYGVDVGSAYRQNPATGTVLRLTHAELPAALRDYFYGRRGG